MSDVEKHDYLVSRGLLTEKKRLTIEDLKKDLGMVDR